MYCCCFYSVPFFAEKKEPKKPPENNVRPVFGLSPDRLRYIVVNSFKSLLLAIERGMLPGIKHHEKAKQALVVFITSRLSVLSTNKNRLTICRYCSFGCGCSEDVQTSMFGHMLKRSKVCEIIVVSVYSWMYRFNAKISDMQPFTTLHKSPVKEPSAIGLSSMAGPFLVPFWASKKEQRKIGCANYLGIRTDKIISDLNVYVIKSGKYQSNTSFLNPNI